MKQILYIIFIGLISFSCTSETEKAQIITEHFINKKEAQLEKLYTNYTLSKWNSLHIKDKEEYIRLPEEMENLGISIKSGMDSMAVREFYELKLHDFYLNKEDFNFIQKMRNSGLIKDKELSRRLNLLYYTYLEENSTQNDSIVEYSTLMEQIKKNYKSYQMRLYSNNFSKQKLDSLQNHSKSKDTLELIWKNEKKVGDEIRDDLLTLIRQQNEIAKTLGYKNYYHLCLLQNELDSEELISISDNILQKTNDSYLFYKSILDKNINDKYSLEEQEIDPWYYGYGYQSIKVPDNLFLNYDSLLNDTDIIKLVKSYYSSINANLNHVFQNSVLDSSAQYGSYSYMMYIDFKNDVRVAASYTRSISAVNAIIHSFGHAVYALNTDNELPFLYRIPNLPFNEGIAYFFTNIVLEPVFHEKYLHLDLNNSNIEAIHKQKEMKLLFLMRTLLFKDAFTRALYENPDQDLNKLYNKLIKEYLQLSMPDDGVNYWASDISFMKGPCRSAFYIYALLIDAHLNSWLHNVENDYEELINSPQLLHYIQPLLKPGNASHFKELIKNVTGEELNYKYFIEANSKVIK